MAASALASGGGCMTQPALPVVSVLLLDAPCSLNYVQWFEGLILFTM